MPRGPVIGPLVVAGVVFEDDAELVKLNVRDSKKIESNKREELAKIIKKIAINYEIIVIPANDIDDMRKLMTLNEIEVNAFSKVIKKLKPELCYVDSADVNEFRFRADILNNLTFKTKIMSKHKADDIYPIVGAASILAKTKRDEIIKKIELELEKKLNLPLGSGYPADPNTKRFLSVWVDRFGKLPPYIRHSWKTSQKIMKEKNTKKLSDF